MDKPTTVLCIAQGEHRPFYALTLELAIKKEFVHDEAGHTIAEYTAYREDVQDALTVYAKRNNISDSQLEVGMVVVADGMGSMRNPKITYSQVALIEYP
tara:strand:+ start:392 stop:688 length:297 start_codon:yes stop_codon:yes gene_type:complete